jgi:hypothetical protein
VWIIRFHNSEIVVGVLTRRGPAPSLIANAGLFDNNEFDSAILTSAAECLDLPKKM